MVEIKALLHQLQSLAYAYSATRRLPALFRVTGNCVRTLMGGAGGALLLLDASRKQLYTIPEGEEVVPVNRGSVLFIILRQKQK